MQFTECTIELLEEKSYLLARRITQPTCILLWGAVGAGKTVFARAFIRSYYENEALEVVSPTFTIVQTYFGHEECPSKEKLDIWHFDLYRIENEREVHELDLREVLDDNICIIEWPDRLQEISAQRVVNVYLNVIDEKYRDLAIQL
ncbi:MAG: tRNA (adenosine(37)-N6)-threonylcarbamoyltransferase complex ATPase subunit type 1 TsaE [Holosporales bacterium]|nr:tRNA (adenosine(37)-N6)-threonylcarbamoyltransferase complex ATPase subunit type 1 TsaE [Holosporales bacterium]